MKFPSDTAAYYFAHAAWGFAQKDEKEGQYWCKTGLKVFGLPRCTSFYDALAGAGLGADAECGRVGAGGCRDLGAADGDARAGVQAMTLSKAAWRGLAPP